MKRFNFSVAILAYKEYDTVYGLLSYIKEAGLVFNNIFICADKIPLSEGLSEVTKAYQYKELVSSQNIQFINRKKHGGVIGTVDYLDMAPITEKEYLVVIEDDLFATVGFFNQCEHFFANIRSNKTPIFVGYSQVSLTESYFKTYSLMHMWGFAMQVNDLRKVIDYHNRVRRYTTDEKQKIINDVKEYVYPCKVFEKYKEDLLGKVSELFLKDSDESVDVYFMFYFLQNRLQIAKPTKSHIRSFKPNLYNEPSENPIEADIKANITNFTV
tara:strand:+ start:12591 stop:13400 length:810 start_codon:yes stop_codon:yes gene_type:complete